MAKQVKDSALSLLWLWLHCGAGLIPELGTSTCCGQSQGKKKKKKKKRKENAYGIKPNCKALCYVLP